MTLELVVHGTPAPQGSKRHVGNGIMIESSVKVKPWRQDVKHAVLVELEGQPLTPMFAGPVFVSVVFYLARPKGHYRTGRNADMLRDSAPSLPVTKPDLDKLLRSTLDALGEAGVWRDDSQVTTAYASKVFADRRPPGADICVAPDVVGPS